MMTETHAREDICRAGASLHARGYVHANAGNISMRLDDGGFLLTPTDACLGTLEPGRLARLDAQGVQVAGDPASKTLSLHRAIYRASSDTQAPAGCIIHTHSTHCVASTLLHRENQAELLPPITPYFVMKVGHVPVLPYRRPGDSSTADSVATLIATYQARHAPIRAVMLPRLGPTVWHSSAANAMAVLEELEETARLWLLTGTTAAPLELDQLDELRNVFGAHW